jgi:hypothetical protein
VQVLRCYWPKTSQQVSLNGALVGVLLSQFASPSVVCLSSPRTINLGFLTEGKLAAILITPSSWGAQRAGHSPRITGKRLQKDIILFFTHTSSTSGDAHIDDYIPLHVVPNVTNVHASDISHTAIQVDAHHNTEHDDTEP